jgi:hypothetical protein
VDAKTHDAWALRQFGKLFALRRAAVLWELAVDQGGSAARRMNKTSGYMEVCSVPALQARCTAMPKPQGS